MIALAKRRKLDNQKQKRGNARASQERQKLWKKKADIIRFSNVAVDGCKPIVEIQSREK